MRKQDFVTVKKSFVITIFTIFARYFWCYKNNKVLFLGDGAINYKEIISEVMGEKGLFYSRSLSIPRAAILAEIASERESDNLITLEPYYISKSQAERKEIHEKEYRL